MIGQSFFNHIYSASSIFPFLAFALAFLITFYSIPSIIKVAVLKNLFDEPNFRKSHIGKIPTLGGLAMFIGFSLSTLLFSDPSNFVGMQYVRAAFVILFFLGMKDDIIVLSPDKKFIGQILSAVILVFMAGLRLTNLNGLFGIYELNYYLSVGLSIFAILVIVNAFNLIDGIDCLAGSIGFICTAAFAAWFYRIGEFQMVIFCTSLLGAILGFLKYNITPARIFMGDTGSLMIGLAVAVMAFKFVEFNQLPSTLHHMPNAPVVAFTILLVPLYDLLKVFSIRLSKKRSPFHPDKIHVHHNLLRLGNSHMRATFLLGLISILFIIAVVVMSQLGWNINLVFIIILSISVLLNLFIRHLVNKRNKNAKS